MDNDALHKILGSRERIMNSSQTYSFVFSGPNGQGFGVLHIEGDKAFAADQTNIMYVGKAIELADGSIKIDMTASIPAGVNLVTGASEQDLPMARPISHTFTKDHFNGEPVSIAFAGSEVTAIFKAAPQEAKQIAKPGFATSFAVNAWGWPDDLR